MKVTNKENLPQPIVDAISNEYTTTLDRYSITTIEKGVREVLLTRRHEKELEMDASDGMWSLLGQLMHKVLEEAQEEANQLKEEFIMIPIPYYKRKGFLPYGVAPEKDDVVERVITISGRFDLYDGTEKEITDYKLTSCWSYVFGGKPEWRKQLSGYGWMMRTLGFPVTKGQNVIVYRDWSRSASLRNADYPRHACQVFKYEFNDKEFVEAYNNVIEKFTAILKYENTPDDELPICSEEERWAKKTTYAVMKNGRKSALRVLNTDKEAVAYMAEKGGDEVVIRIGESTKCKSYCSCNHFCSFWKETYKIEEDAEQAIAATLQEGEKNE